ncbi:MAG: hypothetical protein NWF03_04455, partial [Candidatus Bathyarchaeota archaeon]|nr:hypothetical protein [Candidatus Bathyarchaeota archaeon]
MLRIINLEEIQNLLLLVPAIVEQNEQRDPRFVPTVKTWLTQLEAVLKNNHLPAAANVAALRGNLISTEQGNIPAGITFNGHATKRKVQQATANQCLSQTVEIISSTIQNDANRVAEAQRITRQLVSIAKSKGLITEKPHGKNYTAILKSIWTKMAKDQVLAQGVVSVEGLVGP